MSELYQLPDGWEWKKFDEVSTFIRGITFKPNEKFDKPNKNTIFCFRTTNIQTELNDTDLLNIDLSLIKSDEKFIKNGDILISSANSLELLGKCCLIKNIKYKATLGGFIVCGRAKGNILDEKYFYYFFSSESNQKKMRNLANKTTGIANLPMKKVEKEHIPLAPLEEQKRIVSKLDSLFEKIDNSISLHQKNINEANVFMASVLNDVFSELECRYEKKELSNLVSKLGDGLHGTPKYDENGDYFFVNGTNVKDNQIIVNQNTKKVNDEEYNKYKKELNDRTIFVSINGTIGNVGLYNNEKCILGKSACYFNLLKDIDKIYITYVLKNGDFQEYIEKYSTGATIKNVSLKTMRAYKLPLPPLQTQQKVVAYLDEISQKMDKIKQIQKEKMQSLKALKASILDKAFRGEL